MTRLPHDGLVFIGDGRKALFLRNAGDEKFPDLRAERVFAEENPPTHEQGVDRPTVGFAHAGSHRRFTIDQTDWHRLEEKQFAQRVAAALQEIVRQRDVPAILIAAPPRALADLRHAYAPEVEAKIVAEFDKDLTHLPVSEIESRLLR